jgi:hypothetical protein
MARVNTVTCPSCCKDYYIEKMLSNAMVANPRLKLRCPFCKQEFVPQAEGARAKAAPGSN